MKKKLSSQENLYYASEEAVSLFQKWKEKDYSLLRILKDTNRSYVVLIEMDGKQFVCKEPREKNRRKWQRFLSIFRGSESKREGQQMLEIEKRGFSGPSFQFAYEKKIGPMVTHSFLIYSYIDAEEINLKNAEQAFFYLKKIHEAGFLHGDSQISNFLIHGEKMYIIDSKFKKNYYGALGKAYELYYFELSCPEIVFSINREEISYKIAKKWKDLKECWVQRKTRRREKI